MFDHEFALQFVPKLVSFNLQILTVYDLEPWYFKQPRSLCHLTIMLKIMRVFKTRRDGFDGFYLFPTNTGGNGFNGLNLLCYKQLPETVWNGFQSVSFLGHNSAVRKKRFPSVLGPNRWKRFQRFLPVWLSTSWNDCLFDLERENQT